MTRIGSITVTHNDWKGLSAWKGYYLNYAQELDCHVIVDNNSEKSFREVLKLEFSDSKLIFRRRNGGVTAAFNDGINYLCSLGSIDYILLICPDIEISFESIRLLKSTLLNNRDIGVVAPLLFDVAGSVEIYGGLISENFTPVYKNKGFAGSLDSLPNQLYSTFIPGGICMVKVETYMKVGLQDETLFMYSDEVDWMHRVNESGIKSLFLRDARAYHNHIFIDKGIYRSNLAYFLLNRNIYLLCWKYGNWLLVARSFSSNFPKLIRQILGMIRRGKFVKALALLAGLLYGLLNLRRFPFFINSN